LEGTSGALNFQLNNFIIFIFRKLILSISKQSKNKKYIIKIKKEKREEGL
jgi:hypothetical protein